MTADRELLKPQSISQLRHVVRPVQQPTTLLKVRRTTAGPVNRNNTYSEFAGDVIIRTEVKSRTDPTMEEENRTPFAISVLLIADLPAVGKLHIARINHQAPTLPIRPKGPFQPHITALMYGCPGSACLGSWFYVVSFAVRQGEHRDSETYCMVQLQGWCQHRAD